MIIPHYLDRYAFEERAAIYEYDGGLTRDEAEIRALDDLIREYDRENQTEPQLFN